MRNRIPVYAEDKPHKGFMSYIRKWLKDKNIRPETLLVAKSNLVIVVLNDGIGKSIICFYIQKLCALGNGGVVVYYDVNALSKRLKESVENTFTNWLALTHAL